MDHWRINSLAVRKTYLEAISVTIDTIKLLRIFTSDNTSVDVAEDAGTLLMKLTMLLNTLNGFYKILTVTETKEESVDVYHTLFNTMDDCQKRVTQIHKTFQKFAGVNLSIWRLKWPFKKEEIQQITQALSRIRLFLESFTNSANLSVAIDLKHLYTMSASTDMSVNLLRNELYS